MKKDEFNPNDYQGKSKSQVEGSYYNFIASVVLLIFIILLSLLVSCAPIKKVSINTPEEIIILSIQSTGTVKLIDQGNFTVMADYMDMDSLILLHISGTHVQLVNKKDLKILKGLIYKSGHDKYN